MNLRFQRWFFGLILLSLLTGPRSQGASTNTVSAVAVIVNDAIITYDEIQREIAKNVDIVRRNSRTRAEFQQAMAQLERDTTQNMVEQLLILHEFKDKGYSIPESFFEDYLQDQVEQMYGDRITLIRSLKEDGRTWEDYRQNQKEQLIIDMMSQQKLNDELIISPYKIQQYYLNNPEEFRQEEQIHLRMMVLPKSGSEDPETLEKAKSLRQQILDGASFAELARQHSAGSQARDGGDWGWVERSVLRQELAEVGFALEPGKISEVIETEEANYLMMIEEKRGAQVRPLDEVRDDIEAKLRSEETSRIRQQWIETLRKKSFVRYF